MTFILAGKVGNEESYLLILAAKLSHAVCGVTRGISSDGRHLILGKMYTWSTIRAGGRPSVVTL